MKEDREVTVPAEACTGSQSQSESCSPPPCASHLTDRAAKRSPPSAFFNDDRDNACRVHLLRLDEPIRF